MLPWDQRDAFNLMFHIGVLSAFFADSDFMTLLQSSREGGDALGQRKEGHPQMDISSLLLSPQSAALYYRHQGISKPLVTLQRSPTIWQKDLVTAFQNTILHSNHVTYLTRGIGDIMFVVLPIGVDWSWTSFAPFSCSVPRLSVIRHAPSDIFKLVLNE